MALTLKGIEKFKNQPQGLARSADGGDGQFYPLTLTDDQRLRVDAAVSLSGVDVNLDYSDEATVLPGDPLDAGAQSASNPSLTVARNASNFITSVSSLEYNGGAGATRTITRNASNFITAIGKWV